MRVRFKEKREEGREREVKKKKLKGSVWRGEKGKAK